MKKTHLIIYVFLILILNLNISLAYKIGVSPSKIEIVDFSEIHIVNSNNFSTKFKLISEIVDFELDEFILKPNQIKSIELTLISKINGTIEVLSGNNLISSIIIPVKIIKQESTSKNDSELFNKKTSNIPNKKLSNILILFGINSFGIIMGAIIWKKKIF